MLRQWSYGLYLTQPPPIACERPRPWPVLELDQTHMNGWSHVIASQNKGWLIIFSPLD